MKGFLGSLWDSATQFLTGKELKGVAWCEKYSSSHTTSGGVLGLTVDPRRAFKNPCVIALAIAAQQGDVKAIDKALSAGADVNAMADQGMDQVITPIMFSLIPDQPAALERLLAAGAKPNVLFPQKYSPMLIALSKNDPAFAMKLLDAGADPNGETPFGGPGSLLGRAMILNQAPVAKRLIELGANVHGTYENDPLLLNCIEWEKLGYIPILLNAGSSWRVSETEAFCWYNANKAEDLDRKRPAWTNLQSTWDALEKHGILIPCERLRQ